MNFNSNQQHLIKKEIPSIVQKRLLSLSQIKEIFDKIKAPYKKTLKNCCFQTSLSYVQDNPMGNAKERLKKNIFFTTTHFH